MQAMVCRRYGAPEVLHMEEVPMPTAGGGQVLIRVAATTVTRYDCWARSCRPDTGMTPLARLWFGVRRPWRPILCTELSGEVVATGDGT